MYIRLKKRKNGSKSVVIFTKINKKYKYLHTIGTSSCPEELKEYTKKAKEWIKKKQELIDLDFESSTAKIEHFLDNITKLKQDGLCLILDLIYKEIGFDKLNDSLFKYLVYSRISNPKSKLETSHYLRRYFDLNYDVNKIYRELDQIYNSHKENIQDISYKHTVKVLGGAPRVLFYDVTTMYFEIEKDDNLRISGFSKDGKHQHSQIVLGLLVSSQAYPLAYDIFPGNTYEGNTFLPIIQHFKRKYKLENLIVVADSGLINLQNIKELKEKGFDYILGARIKNQKKEIKDQIIDLSFDKKNNQSIQLNEEEKMVISYSAKRAKKDAENRKKGLSKLEKKVKTGQLNKTHINNRGYNKYLSVKGKASISINYEKFKLDSVWDGLKGYQTNCKMSNDEIIQNYNNLWEIEKAFRITKTDLKVRPIYHRVQRRIEAHICITFTAYKLYKELERVLKIKDSKYSINQVIEIAKTIFSISVIDKQKNCTITRLLTLSDEQKYIANLFQF